MIYILLTFNLTKKQERRQTPKYPRIPISLYVQGIGVGLKLSNNRSVKRSRYINTCRGLRLGNSRDPEAVYAVIIRWSLYWLYIWSTDGTGHNDNLTFKSCNTQTHTTPPTEQKTPKKPVGLLSKMLCTSGSSLILTWTGYKWSHGQANDCFTHNTHVHTDGWTQTNAGNNTQRPKLASGYNCLAEMSNVFCDIFKKTIHGVFL